MSDHASALEAAMKAGGFDPLNHVARKAVEDAIAAYLSELNTDPVGYVTKLELTKLRLGVGCVDLFGNVVPKGFEMVPVFAAPPAEANAEIERLRRMVERRDEFIIANGLWDAFKGARRGED
ncbi:hypothetical protein HJB79_18010 [Rhizobium lentis]|uniref:hypothetical protein n=1 Tax=Rhizobium lentis TaxID=1138194 RepID=UPI001C828E76|nr:hypothetical protein [Rhizobium lentis]MBX5140650.1 hypothetical protein [Rhizobium lentis]